jgi:hypothetical protein
VQLLLDSMQRLQEDEEPLLQHGHVTGFQIPCYRIDAPGGPPGRCPDVEGQAVSFRAPLITLSRYATMPVKRASPRPDITNTRIFRGAETGVMSPYPSTVIVTPLW